MPPESSAPRGAGQSAQRRLLEAVGHLAGARTVLARPWAQDPGQAPLYLSRACECLRAAAKQGGLDIVDAAPFGQIGRELAAVRALLAAAAEANAAWMEAAGLLSATYGRDGECAPAACAARISARA